MSLEACARTSLSSCEIWCWALSWNDILTDMCDERRQTGGQKYVVGGSGNGGTFGWWWRRKVGGSVAEKQEELRVVWVTIAGDVRVQLACRLSLWEWLNGTSGLKECRGEPQRP